MAERFQSVWMALLLASITMMLLQPQEAECWDCRFNCFKGQSVTEFEREVKDKCQQFLGRQNVPADRAKTRCDTFWKKFTSAFVKKDPDTIAPGDYNDLFNTEPIAIPKDKLLLYSGTGEFLDLLDNQDTFVHVWNTFYSILANKLWCGQSNNKDVFSEGCPPNPANMFWASISAALAKGATGTVTVLLNGKLGYMPDSFFAKFEVPNLDFNKVTALHVLMINDKDENTCETDSVKNLRNIMKEHRNLFKCKFILQKNIGNTEPANWWDLART
uniref:ADP-ribosyl cyclase/cyclic ADP-ribose hydrolase-like n=1 Tax=Centroberyx gerrardi TaxID=166262 RepID=UPI003AAE7E56